MILTKIYLIIIGILIALPVSIAAITIVYNCFKLSNLAGYISLGVCLFIILLAVFIILKKIKEAEND